MKNANIGISDFFLVNNVSLLLPKRSNAYSEGNANQKNKIKKTNEIVKEDSVGLFLSGSLIQLAPLNTSWTTKKE